MGALVSLAVVAVIVFLAVKVFRRSIDNETKKNVTRIAKMIAILFGALLVLGIVIAIGSHH
jgi:nitrate reductase gamma subunit